MSNKTIHSRIVHKHDTETNWLKSSFTPKQGEIIIYDIDATHTAERIKIGDGIKNVNALPFVDDAVKTQINNLDADDFGIYVQASVPTNAVDGDIWIDTANDPSYIVPTLPQITEEDNGKVLMVVNGRLQLVSLNLSIDADGVVSI